MYRRPKFLEVLLKIRQDMSCEADYDVDLFTEMVRSGNFPTRETGYDLNEVRENAENQKSKIKNQKS